MHALVDRVLSAPRAGQAFAITLAAYLLAAWLALFLTIPPGIASPLFPAAGIALAAALVWGRPALAAVWLGSAAANLWHAASIEPTTLLHVVVVASIGLGAALQAGVGALLINRFAGQPLLLAEPSQLWRVIALGALVSTCISSSIGLAALSLAGKVDAAQALSH